MINEKILQTVLAKEIIAISIRQRVNESADLEKLLKLFENKKLKTHLVTPDEKNLSYFLNEERNKIMIITDEKEIFQLGASKGISVIGVFSSEEKFSDFLVFPDVNSVYNALNWAFNCDKQSDNVGVSQKIVSIIPSAGKGTRLGYEKPKVLYPIGDTTPLKIQYEKLKPLSERVIFITNPEGENEINNYILREKLNAETIVVRNSIGNADTILASEFLSGEAEDALIIWGDQIGVPENSLRQLVSIHQKNNSDFSFSTRLRKNPYIHFDRNENGKISSVLRKRFNDIMPAYGENDTGVFVIKKNLLYQTLREMKEKHTRENKKEEFDFLDAIPYLSEKGHKIVTAPVILDEEKLGFNTIEEANFHIEKMKNKKSKAIFLDRDGVINEDIGYITSIDEIKILEGIPEALKFFKKTGYKLIVITNQAVVSKGLVTEEQIEEIHRELNEKLIQQGGEKIEKFYFCPHHPHSTIPKYGVICDCRKPANGLIVRAALENNIDLKKSWFIGDRITDVAAGKNSGCKTILLKSDDSHKVNVSNISLDKDLRADYEIGNILEATAIISKHKNDTQ